MRHEDVREHLDRQPFEPFRIHMSDGVTFDVRHPDLCMVARSTANAAARLARGAEPSDG